MNDEPIDAVVTWVDGSDPQHRAKREATLTGLGKSTVSKGIIPGGKKNTRFTDNGEIFWCLHSIRKFAPWIRRIYLVTDNQVPVFLTPALQRQLQVRIVDHHEIFRDYEWALPTFNSNAIETMLWRIKELSPNFIYFNDDVILLQPTTRGSFFEENRPILRGSWQRVRGSSPVHQIMQATINLVLDKCFRISRTMQLYHQMNGAALVGYQRKYYRSNHVPHPLRVSTFAEYFKQHPEDLEVNLVSAFRNQKNFFPVPLANHLEIEADAARFEPCSDQGMFSGEYSSSGNVRRLFSHLDGRMKFLCLQSFERFNQKDRDLIRTKLNSILGLH